MDYTIAETFTLPSHGLVYDKKVNADVKLRSMTTADEMRRLAPSKPGNQYKILSDLIDDCIVSDLGISSYDMCVGDYQFLLYKLRVVTYGSDYKVSFECPNCHDWVEANIDLDTALQLRELKEFDLAEQLTVHLPRSNKDVTLRLQTPRSLDRIEERCEAFRQKVSKADDYTRFQDPHIRYQLMEVIDLVDGTKLPEYKLENFVDSMPMADANVILKRCDVLNDLVGYGPIHMAKCPECGFDAVIPLRITSEFFRPSVD